MEMELEGKKALVTGATSGIGREIALQMAREGAEVVLSGRDAERGAAAVREIEEAGGRARFVDADVAGLEEVARLAEEAGPVDVLVNNAGIFEFAPTVEQDVAGFERLFDVNVRAPYFLTAALVPGMAERGGGAIVNVTTMAAELGLPGGSAYGATKAAVASLTRTWASELAGSGIRVNAVSPGPTDTGGTEGMDEEQVDFIRGLTALRRSADPAEIASLAVFLASDRASYMTGAVVAADGGATAVLA
jgi:NAD(P)-dependent dehydrogenase (short-subunit alcohol dehydrogenase family)